MQLSEHNFLLSNVSSVIVKANDNKFIYFVAIWMVKTDAIVLPWYLRILSGLLLYISRKCLSCPQQQLLINGLLIFNGSFSFSVENIDTKWKISRHFENFNFRQSPDKNIKSFLAELHLFYCFYVNRKFKTHRNDNKTIVAWGFFKRFWNKEKYERQVCSWSLKGNLCFKIILDNTSRKKAIVNCLFYIRDFS